MTLGIDLQNNTYAQGLCKLEFVTSSQLNSHVELKTSFHVTDGSLNPQVTV